MLKYVLITPARNEAEFIEHTLKSVVSQTVRPVKWAIVSDGSTDGTDDLVRRYSADFEWIELLRLPDRRERHFAGKVMAFNAGYELVRHVDHDVVVSLDADISFDESYFSFLLQKLEEDATLGLVGTPFQEDSAAPYDYRFTSINHVSGACQVFRRQCFEDIGGYVPVKGGCIDHIAVVAARMKSWKTRTFVEKVSWHHRKMGTAGRGVIGARFRNGVKDYSIGNHPLWECCRACYQMTKSPVLVGGVSIALGFLWASVRRFDRPVSSEMLGFVRREQMDRLKRIVRR